MSVDKYRSLIREVKSDPVHWTETAIADFTTDIISLMEKNGVSRSELAKRLGASPAYVTKILAGNANFTLTTMTKLARALNAIVRVHVAPEGVAVTWRESPFERQTSTSEHVQQLDTQAFFEIVSFDEDRIPKPAATVRAMRAHKSTPADEWEAVTLHG